MLQAADPVDPDSPARKFTRPLNARLGDEKERWLAQTDHDPLERRALTRRDNAGCVAS